MTAPDLSDATALVTGGAGFIGSHLVAALPDGTTVRVLDDCSTGRATNVPDGVSLFRGDVRDPADVAEAMEGVDVVFHLAALVSASRSVETPWKTQTTNTDGTLRVLDRAREESARVVLASTAAVYGEPQTLPVHESEPRTPTSPYGISKLAADQYARAYTDLYDLPAVALRYFNVYGRGQQAGRYSGVISTFVEQALSSQPLTVHGDGTQTRDFVHVDDVVRATIAAAETDAVGRAFNVGSGERTSVMELARTIKRQTGTDAEIVHTEPRKGDIEHSHANVEAAREALDYAPQVDIDRGIESLLRDVRPSASASGS